MPTARYLLIATLTTTACKADVDDRAEHAAERVQKAQDHLRHERGELAADVARRADDRAARADLSPHVDAITEEVADVTREATELADAEASFDELRRVRVASLRAEHALASSQPTLIELIGSEKTLSPVLRTRLAENLAIFRQRLEHTRTIIDKLERVSPREWERRDDEVGRAMAGMFLARDACWHALDDKPRDEGFPEA